MLGPDAHSTQLQKWYDRLSLLVAQARAQMRAMDPQILARRSGSVWDSGDALGLRFWGELYRVRLPELLIEQTESRARPSDFTQALLLAYLATADGTPPSGQWIAYRDLPDGMFYAQAFRGYAEARLARELGAGGIDLFRRGMERLGATPERLGSGAGHAAYSVQVLPRIRLAAVYWLGDEDFPSQASVLFESTAAHYLSTDGLAVLGSHLVNRILKGTQG